MSENNIHDCSMLILLLPLLGAVVAIVLRQFRLGDHSHWPVIFGVGGAAFFALNILWMVLGAEVGQRSVQSVIYTWISTGAASSWFNFEFLVDPLSAMMLVTVTFVSTLVVIYARDYMRHDDHPERGYERFFAFLALFVFSMCTLVLAGNFLLLYMGWELVGLCSYLLIGFYYNKPSAAAAAKKAFLVNRIGDFGFGLGILLIYWTFGCLDYASVFHMIEEGVAAGGQALPEGRLAMIALLLLCGAVGKSAQLPLYVWLPDAMEGPTPVSALIHAATMVTAGVYMVARCGAIFTASPAVMTVVAIIGAATALFAATIALVQNDMKRVLAYSTVSQLGYMFLGLGVYAAGSAVFHLFTHAFFKALLFLSAGSVMHAMGGIIDMRKFGGLRKVLPWTYRFCLLGALALAGFPFFSGFFSKDEIIHHAFNQNFWLGMVGSVTAVMTAFYTFRMIFMTFHGPERIPEGVHAHESGKWILFPLGVLSIGAVFAGLVQVPGEKVNHFLEPAIHQFHAAHGLLLGAAGHAVAHGFWAEYGLMIISGGLAILAIGVAYLLHVRWEWLPGLLADVAPKTHRVLYNKYYVDEAYDAAVVKPLRKSGRICFGIDQYFVDGLVFMVTAVPRLLGAMLRSLQGGAMQSYGLTMVTGLAIIVLLVLLA